DEMTRYTPAVAGNAAQRNARRHEVPDLSGRSYDVPPEFQLRSKHVGSAGGQNRQWDLRMDQTFGEFVDRAVATGSDDEAGAPGDIRPRNPGRGPRPLSRRDRDAMSARSEGLHDTLNQ